MISGSSDRLKGVACGLVSAFIWGAFPVITRFGIEHSSLDMHDITFLRYGVSGLILLPYLLKAGLKGLGWKPIVLMTIGIGAPYMLVVSHGLTHAPVESFAVITPGSMITFSVVCGAYSLKSRLSRRELAGIAAIIVGACLTGYSSFGHLSVGGPYAWAVFVLGGLMWSIYTVSTKVFSVNSLHATAIVSVFSMLFYFPFYIVMKGPSLLGAPAHEIITQAVYQGILVSTVALFFYSKAVFYLGPSIGSTFAALVPGSAVVLAAVVLGEQPGLVSLVGLCVVTLGMVLTLVHRSSPNRTIVNDTSEHRQPKPAFRD